MPEETKQLILEIEFSTEKQIAEAARLRQAIDADKVALAALNAEGKKNGGLTAEQAVQVTKLEQSIKKNTQARNGEVKSMENYSKAITNAIDKDGKYNGSINNLRGSLAFLTDKWNNLTKAERDNAAIGGVLQKELKQTSDTLKNLEGSVGDNRRSVGGYAQAILSSIPGLGGMAKGIEGVGLAMKASPLGIFTTALQVLPQLLNSSGEGADFFAKIMEQVNAVIQVGLKRLVALGGSFVKLISGDFKGAFNDGKAALTGFTAEVKNAVAEGGNLADRLDALEVAESKFTVTSAKTKQEIEKLLIQARNRTTAEGERIRLLERAEKLEVGLNRQALKLANERLALIKKENAIKQGDEDEEQKRVNEQLARITELETESANIQEKIQVRKDQIADAAEAKEQIRKAKAKEAAEKAFTELMKRLNKENDAIQDLVKNRDKMRAEQAAEDRSAKDEYLKINDEQAKASFKIWEKTYKDLTTASKEHADSEKERLITQATQTKEFTIAMGNLIGQSLAEQEFNAQKFAQNFLFIIIDMLEKQVEAQVIASVTSATAQSFSEPDSVLTAGATGAARAAVLAGLIKAGFSVFKGIMTNLMTQSTPSPAKYADGTVLQGPSHANGGIQMYSPNGYHYGEAEGGETILTAGVQRNPALAAIASLLNQAAGGKPLGPTRYAAAGGVLTDKMPTATRNFTNKIEGIGIDYNKLADAMAKRPTYVIPTEIRAHENKRSYAQSRATLSR